MINPNLLLVHSRLLVCLRWALGGCFFCQSRGAGMNLCSMKMYESIFCVPRFSRWNIFRAECWLVWGGLLGLVLPRSGRKADKQTPFLRGILVHETFLFAWKISIFWHKTAKISHFNLTKFDPNSRKCRPTYDQVFSQFSSNFHHNWEDFFHESYFSQSHSKTHTFGFIFLGGGC